MLAVVGHNSSTRTRCIYRAHGDRGYTKIKNTFLQDRRISDETRGLVARLLSLPDDWEVTVQSIIASGKAGRDKVYRMLKEAEAYGYIHPEERQRDEEGKLGRQIYLVSDDPEALINLAAQELYEMESHPCTENTEVDENPSTGKPDTANTDVMEDVAEQQVLPRTAKPDVVKPEEAKPRLENTDAYKRNIEDNINNPPIVPPSGDVSKPKSRRKRDAIPDSYSHDFEEFWKVYPRREGKGKAYEAWRKLKISQKRRAYLALKQQLAFLKSKLNDNGRNVCPHPSTWINQGRFDDDVSMPAARSVPQQFKSANERQKDTDDAWLEREFAAAKREGIV